MRRPLAFVIVLPVLASCARQPALPSEEVLQRSLLASQNLMSASFFSTIEVEQESAEGNAFEGEITLDGRLQDGGKQVTFALRAEGTASGGEETRTFAVQAEVVIAGEDEVYVLLNSLAIDPPSAVFAGDVLQPLLNRWWRLPASGTGGLVRDPDPAMLELQMQSLTVTRERGIVDLDGHDAYRYDVSIDRERMLTYLTEVARRRGDGATPAEWEHTLDTHDILGRVWIDATSFHVLRLEWDVEAKEAQPLSIAAQIDLRDHNAAAPIQPPSRSEPLPPSLVDVLPLAPGVDGAFPLPLPE